MRPLNRLSRPFGRTISSATLIFLLPVTGFTMMQRSPVSRPFAELQHPAIQYYQTAPTDPVAKLMDRVDRGEVQLRYDTKGGYLASLLDELGIDVSSQLLVASKTSLQIDQISPETPRAIYFNDSVYVGWVQGSPLVELSAVDAKLGATFYTVAGGEGGGARFEHEMGLCLQCHDPSMPSHIMTSVIPDKGGLPVFTAGLFSTSDQSPFPERWGGWYVTGTHGGQVHMGNLIADIPPSPPGISRVKVKVDRSEGANLTQLASSLVDTTPYLGRHSDIVALMVLGHQVNVSNQITHLGYETRKALHLESTLDTELGREEGPISPVTLTRINAAAELLVGARLFSGEVRLTSPIDGTSGFADHFASQGPWDDKGRSLRQFDLTRRLFRYPLSYLIYSESFQSLPEVARGQVYQLLWEVLVGEDRTDTFAHLSDSDRGAIIGILEKTESGFTRTANQLRRQSAGRTQP